VSFSPSRSTHNNGVAGGASVDAALPFTVKFVVIVSSLPVDDGRAMCVVNDYKIERLRKASSISAAPPGPTAMTSPCAASHPGSFLVGLDTLDDRAVGSGQNFIGVLLVALF
jgi:hypothetical protein